MTTRDLLSLRSPPIRTHPLWPPSMMALEAAIVREKMEREQAIQYTKDVQIKVLKERIDSHEQLCREFFKANPTAREGANMECTCCHLVVGVVRNGKYEKFGKP